MTEFVLKLTGLVKDFDGKRAVNQISLCSKKGEILGLLGPNGAGKTTTIRMIMNIIAPDAGNIEILGQEFAESIKDRIGYLPEERGLYRKLKVSETLDFFGKLKGMKSSRITARGTELLKKFDLSQYRNRKVEELSKGMSQKLQLITAIIHSPELLILDEPFSGLDPVNIELVKDLILELKQKGVSIIFSTHLMEYAEKIVDSLVMINGGRKVLDGTLDDIRSTFGASTAKITYSGQADFLKSLDYIKRMSDYGHELEIELEPDTDRNRLLQDMVGKIDIKKFEFTAPSLNTIFIQKVREKRKEPLAAESRSN